MRRDTSVHFLLIATFVPRVRGVAIRMEVTPGADGIQKLLAAEQAAQNIIQAARTEKSTKIKQAQQEAEKEVAQYKEQREDAYKKMMEAGKGDAAGRLAKLESDTGASITSLEHAVQNKKPEVTTSIVGWVTKVN